MRMSKILSRRLVSFVGLAILTGCQGSQTAQVSKPGRSAGTQRSDTVEELGDLISDLINDRIQSEEALSDSMELGAVALLLIKQLPNGERTEVSYRRYSETQLALLKSSFVMNAALRDPKINQLSLLVDEEDPLGWIKSRIKTSDAGKSEIMRIELRGNVGEELQLTQILDAIVSAYMDEFGTIERNEKAEKIDLLRAASRDLHDRMDRTQAKLDVRKKSMPISSDGEPSVAVRRLEHRVVLSQERITRLSLKRDDLTLQQAEAVEPNKADLDKVSRTLAALNELMKSAEADYASACESLDRLLTASAPDGWQENLLTLEVQQQQLKELIADEAAIQRKLREPARVQLVQPALITHDDDPDGEKAWKKELESLKQELRDESSNVESV